MTESFSHHAFSVPAFPPFAEFTVPTTKILAVGTLSPAFTNEEVAKVRPYEVRQTVALHLGGKIEQWWALTATKGVVFIMSCATTAEAHALLETLPLGVAGMMTFELTPIGPLKPLMLLAGTPV